jgi:competence protein ComEC
VLTRNLGHRAPLLWLVLPWIAGMGAARGFDWEQPTVPLAAAAGACGLAAIGAWRVEKLCLPAIVMALFCAGAGCHALHRTRLPAWDELPPREARVSVRVTRVFAQADPRRSSGLAEIVRAENPLGELQGQRIYFSLQLARGIRPPIRSGVVEVAGILEPLPRHPPADSFDGYLSASGANFRLNRGRVLTELELPAPYYAFCARMAARFKTILGHRIADKRPALAGLLRAMMLGETRELSDEQHTLFMQSGTMHLFAISGLNIGVIAGSLQCLLLLLRVPAVPRFFIGTTLLWLFVDITGGSPSAVRAFGMAAFFHLARVTRRPANPLAALAASAFAVLLIAPLQVFSASFLMSYAIVTALFVYGLPLADTWQARWTPWRALPEQAWHKGHRFTAWLWRVITTAVAVGVATTLVSLLTGVQFFQLLTPGALLANLALIPAAMGATVAGFTSVLFGLLGFDSATSVANHAAALVLAVIESLVRLSVRLPGAYLPAHFVSPWVGSAALALLLASLLTGYACHWQRFGRWWTPVGIVILTLAAGVTFGEA